MKTYSIREIQPKDKAEIAHLIQDILVEFKVPIEISKYNKIELEKMFEPYESDESCFFILTNNDEIIGGAGITQYQNSVDKICQLEKMYLIPEARGKGLGLEIIDICLQKAKELGYEKCFLEVLPYMERAQKLYQKSGFEIIELHNNEFENSDTKTFMLKTL